MTLLATVDLNLLVPLLALLEERNVTRAANRVGLSQPAMSHTLRRCRKLLDDELLVRMKGGMQLTPRARRVLDPLATILGAVEDTVLDRAQFDPARSTRNFRISGQSTTAMAVLPALEQRLGDRAPGIVLSDVGPVPLDTPLLDLRGVDVALISGSVPSDLARERLYSDRWVAITAPGHAAANGAMGIEQFGSMQHVVFDTTPFRSPVPPYQVLERHSVPYTVRMRVHDFLLVPMVLRGTELIAVCQERAATLLEEAGLVRIQALDFELPPLYIDMVWNPRVSSEPAAKWLRQELQALFA